MTLLRLLAIALTLGAVAPAAASGDRFVDPGGPAFLSHGNEMVVFDGFVYFAADDGVVGNELWRTDGTAAGTTLVKDFSTGGPSSHGNPSGFRVVGERLFFNVQNDDVDDGDLIVYYLEPGGSPQKTRLSTNLPATGTLLGAIGDKVLLRQLEFQNGNANYGLYVLGATGSTFTKISYRANSVGDQPGATLNGKAYFGSATGPNGATELWVTDGTSGGTKRLKDIRIGAEGSGPEAFVATTSRVYFTADDGARGRELWATDGTATGTTLVREHGQDGAGTSISVGPVAQGDTLYYIPSDPDTGQEVWRTQGTEGTTSVVKDITPGPGSGVMTLFAFKNGLGILRGEAIYFSDGTDAGTTLLGRVDGDGYGPDFPLAAGGQAYFRGGFSPFGGAVWRTDGTPEGTFALTAGPFEGATSGAPMAGPFVQLGTKVIFTGSYPHPEGDPVPANARRIFFIDTAQPDDIRQATAPPSIAGTPTVGQKLTGNPGTWTREPNAYVYEWLRNGTPIPNVPGTEYTLQPGDVGTQISFRVTASGTGYPNRVTAESAPVTVAPAPITPGPPTTPVTLISPPTPPTVTPIITPPATPALTVRRAAKLTGVARVGKRLKLSKPLFAEPGVKLKIRWYANGKRIKKQTKSVLKITKALKKKRISVRITATKTGYTTQTLTPRATKKVKPRRR